MNDYGGPGNRKIDHDAVVEALLAVPRRTLDDVAAEFGTSQERIRQIGEMYGVVRPHVYAHLFGLVEDASRTATTIREVAEAVGIPERTAYNLFQLSELEAARLRVEDNHRRARRYLRCSYCGAEVLRASASHGSICNPCNRETQLAHYHSKKLVEYPTVDGRTCSACRLLKPAASFNRSAHHWTGLQTYCRDCQNRIRDGETVPGIQLDLWGETFPRTRLDKPKR